MLHLHYYTDGEYDVCIHILLLQKFSQLRSFHITGDGTNRGTVWNIMPEGLRVQLIRLISSPVLEALSLTRLHSWPVSLFAHCCALRQLQIGALGLDDTNLTTFALPPFPPACQLQRLSIGPLAFHVVDNLISAKWPDGSSVVDLSLITVLHDHSIHAPIQKLVEICGPQIETFYFACMPISRFYQPSPNKALDLDRFRTLTESNEFKALQVIIGNAHLHDFRQPPKCCVSVEEIYLMIRPASAKPIKIEHVIPWLNPAIFPALRSFITFQEYGVNSETMLQLPFVSGPAIFKTRTVKNMEEFWVLVSSVTGLSNFDC